MKNFLTVLGLFFLAVSVKAQAYSPADAGSKVKFVIRNLGFNTGGTFSGLNGKIVFDPVNLLNSDFEVSIDAKTIDTDIESRDNHLRGSEYFDVQQFPKLSFKSTKITKSTSSKYLYMFGIVTIKGVAKEIQFPFKATPAGDGYLFEGEFNLNRRDFGVGGNSLTLADEVKISLAVFARRLDPAQARK